MPRGNNFPQEQQFARALIIGPSKAGKTHWVCEAATAGYNILYLDGDNSKATILKAAGEHAHRIYYMDCHDALEHPRFNRVVKRILQEPEVIWNDTEQRFHTRLHPVDETHEYWRISAPRLNSNWIFVMDSWSTYAFSLVWEWSVDNSVDLYELTNNDLSMYGSIGTAATATLHTLACLPCHLVVTAHPDEFVKFKKLPGKQNKKMSEQEVEWSRLIPKSTSRPHGNTMAPLFPDVLWIEIDAQRQRYIDGRVAADKDGGGHFDGRELSSKYSFANLVLAAGGDAPTDDLGDAITIYPPGEYQPATAQGNKPLDATEAPVTNQGLGALLGGQK